MEVDFARNLTEEPSHHPDCCVAISRHFLTSLLNLLPSYPALVLSVGSGSGYLEACLLYLAGSESLNLLGLEVSPLVNKFLPEEYTVYVHGTYSLYEGAAAAEVLLFVYPREPRLMARYLQQLGQSSCQKIIWIGPVQDWPDYEDVLKSSDFASINVPAGCRVADYEMVCVATKC